jgi:OOP family OmpA-OmpF porin
MFFASAKCLKYAAFSGVFWLIISMPVEACQNSSATACSSYSECFEKGINFINEKDYEKAVTVFATARTFPSLSDNQTAILNGHIGLAWNGIGKVDEARAYLEVAKQTETDYLKTFKDELANITAVQPVIANKMNTATNIQKNILAGDDIAFCNSDQKPLVRGFIDASQPMIIVAQVESPPPPPHSEFRFNRSPPPPPPPPSRQCWMIKLDIPIEFEYKSTVLEQSGVIQADEIGKTLLAQLDEDASAKFFITGHTDMYGGDPYNLSLSRQRAQAVKSYLFANFPELRGRITADGKGKRDLLVTEDDREKQAKNRRVEIGVKKCRTRSRNTSSGVG